MWHIQHAYIDGTFVPVQGNEVLCVAEYPNRVSPPGFSP